MKTQRTLGIVAVMTLGLGLGPACIEVGERIPNVGQVDAGNTIGQDGLNCTGPDCGGQGGCLKAADGTCIACVADAECPQGVCDPALGACVQCVDHADCGEGFCHPGSQLCVACFEDSQCPGGVCTAAGACTECVADSHCGGGGTCTPNGHCAGSVCNASVDCNDGDPCTAESCSADGKCAYKLAPDGTACDDGDACTVADTCAIGVCAGVYPPGVPVPGCCGGAALGCDWPTVPLDTDGDGCPESCLCPGGGAPLPDGTCPPCPGAVTACPQGSVPWDATGDGCMDACQCASADCVSCYGGGAPGIPSDPADPAVPRFVPDCDDFDPCTDDVCQLGVCVSLAVPGCGICPAIAILCEGGLIAGDTDGDGCDDACVCPSTLLPPGPAGCTGPIPCADACDCYDAGAAFPSTCDLDCATCDNYWLCESGQCVAQCGAVPDILKQCQPICMPLGCPVGAYGVDSDGDNCLDTCMCVDGQLPDPVKGCGGGTGCMDPAFAACAQDSQPHDGNGDGCPDWCMCTMTGALVLPGEPCPCATAIACPAGSKPVDTNGDGCDDTCLCDGAGCGACNSDLDCATGVACTVGLCVDGVCVTKNDCCPPSLPCPIGMVPLDDHGDGCFEQCACANGTPPDATGSCGCNVAIGCGPGQIPVDTDGDGCDDTCQTACQSACDCYTAGLKFQDPCPLACATCGNYWACEGGACVEQCGAVPPEIAQCQPNAKAQLCHDTGGSWDMWACGDYTCGFPNECAAIIPGCNCGPGRTFVEGAGCQADPSCQVTCLPFACPTGQVGADLDGDGCADLCLCVDGSVPDPMGNCGASEDEVLCHSSGGTWHDFSCGDYWCGQPPICLALIPGCDCGPHANFTSGKGCLADPACEGGCEPITCPTGTLPWDSNGDGCDDLCLCPDGTFPDAAGTCWGNSGEMMLCLDTGGAWDAFSCGHYQCGMPPLCDAIIPGCDCGPTATFDAGKGCVPDPNCGAPGCDPTFTCPPGQVAVDTNGDGCFDFCTAECADQCDCYDANLPHAQECLLLCPNCGNFWTCEQGLCASQCGQIPQSVQQCFATTCDSTAHCPAGQWCNTAPGECGGAGSCIPLPPACDAALYDPVCGCDGKTYPSQCFAALADVSILYKGVCAP
jgi:hypothetical protein